MVKITFKKVVDPRGASFNILDAGKIEFPQGTVDEIVSNLEFNGVRELTDIYAQYGIGYEIADAENIVFFSVHGFE